MTTFVYKAKKPTAETVTGQIDAESQEEAVDLINRLGLLPVTLEEKGVEEEREDLTRPRKITNKELYVFSTQLANLLRSGVSLLRSLLIIEEQIRNPYFRSVVGQIARGIKNGRSLSECLADYPQIFSSLYVTMVSAGEESGNIQEMLVNVATYQKKQADTMSKIRMAMAYPVLMGIVGILTVYFILTFVLPKMAGLFDSLGETLPLPTVILLETSRFLKGNILWILIGIFSLIIISIRLGHIEKSRIALSRMALKVPLFGQMILRSELARFSRTLVLLMRSGVSIIKALQIAIPILSNDVIKLQLEECREKLTSGGSFGEGLRESRQIPDMMGHLITVGEESGNLTEVLSEIADTYEQETDEQMKLMTTLFEPMMILIVGCVVGFIVFAMLLPIFQIDVLAQ